MKSFVVALFALLCGHSLAELIGPYNVTGNDQASTQHGNLRRRLCSPSVSVTKGTYASNEQIHVVINICQKSTPEWFGIYVAGTVPGRAPAVNWQFTCGGQSCFGPQNIGGYIFGLDGNTISTGSSSWPLPSGSYVIYYHSAFGSFSTATFSIGSGPSSLPDSSGSAPSGSEAQAWLDAHNLRRSKYNKPAVSWDASLAEQAKDWADYLVNVRSNPLCPLTHISNECSFEVGENLATDYGGDPRSPEMVLKAWTEDEMNLVPSRGPWIALHATQVLWQHSTKIGCAMSQGSCGAVQVCRYHPAGNYNCNPDCVQNILQGNEYNVGGSIPGTSQVDACNRNNANGYS